MRFASPSLHCLAAAATDATMSSSRASSRGRNQWRRGFSDRPSDDRDAFVSGDSHFRSVRDVNYGIRQGERGNYGGFQRQVYRPRPSFHEQQPFRQQLPKPMDFRNWKYAKEIPPPHCERFIVLSYNILADYLAINHRRELYFHIPRHILDWEWRKRRIMIELGLWSADIMCFQEVDRFHDLEEELKLQGYSGIWKLYNPYARFKLLQEEFIEFNKLGLRDNIAQICVLESGSQNAAAGNGSADLPTSFISFFS
ncbi:hypothetical protein HHK36_021518 [Tetracentron sinense]|uniref:Endonuclease/exonuclease/phosphatase domain-containing protein n=1 Tax=Tetracentron sinense TaxID=13715 RepID=A0A834YX09_TETSI|nr:hypothetical protein HHK36_021518 [Tetracentron sinense]